MTAPTQPPAGPHLDDEQLSARIDGDVDAVIEAHLAGCGRCVDRLADLAAVGPALTRGPDLSGDETRDASIAAALAVWDAEIAPGLQSEDELAARRALRGRAIPRWLVAAAVLVVVGLAALPFLRLGDDDAHLVADAGAPTADREVAAGGGGASDLGSIDDVSVLDERLRAVLGIPAGAEVAEESFDAAAGAAQLTSEPLGAASDGDRAKSTTKSLSDCQSAAVAFAGDEHTTNAYSASLTFRSTPAYVYVFVKGSGESLSRRAVVVDRSGCALLVVQSF